MDDLDVMSDVYMTREQRAAFDRIVADRDILRNNLEAQESCDASLRAYIETVEADRETACQQLAATIAERAVLDQRCLNLVAMFGRIFAAQRMNAQGEYCGWKIAGAGSLNEVVAEARLYLDCPLMPDAAIAAAAGGEAGNV